jgi:hypothetical protein
LAAAAAGLAAFLSLEPALAVMRGEPARDPNGTRRSTVMVESPEGLCTGTIIGPDLILTAGHCVAARGQYRVRFLDSAFRRVGIPVQRVEAHPGFDSRHGFAGDDVGLIQVARPFPGDLRPATLPAAGWGGWFTSEEARGRELIIAGFGSTERRRSRDGILREALMRTTSPSVPGRGFSGLSGEEQAQRPGMCVGDSGGPVYERRAGSFTVVGILKGGTTDQTRECTVTPIFTQVRDYVGWIQGMARQWNTVVGAGPGRARIEMRQ